ncbi:hypothetical protein Btru_055407 [Bulinus truncatus]|nr:hypothetical protein Btru_055407 [Bulinus truncatus]
MTFKPILLGQPHPFRATVLVEYCSGARRANVNNCPKLNNQGLYECDAHCVCRDGWNNTYGCIRYETQQESYKYCAMQDNDNPLVYDLRADPFELTNLAKTASPDLLTKLSQDLADLSLCAGETCHKKIEERQRLIDEEKHFQQQMSEEHSATMKKDELEEKLKRHFREEPDIL